MGRIEETFRKLSETGKKALIPYIMAGDPDLEVTEHLIEAIEKAGADILELGVPFSDPIADGPTIQRSTDRALRSDTTLKRVIGLVKKVRHRGIKIPLIIMTYFNIIFQYGLEQFVHDAINAGVDGLIVPDLPPEEAGDLLKFANQAGLDIIFLLAPTSTEERIKLVTQVSRGFIYFVSMTGITGSTLRGLKEIREKVPLIKQYTNLPVVVGFGISNKREARNVARLADGVVIGSAIIRIIEVAGRQKIPQKVAQFIRGIKRAIK